MKKLIWFIIALIILICSCDGEKLKKTDIRFPLSTVVLSECIENDSSFYDFYNIVAGEGNETLKAFANSSDANYALCKGVTYYDVWKYYKMSSDDEFCKRAYNSAVKKFEIKYPEYKQHLIEEYQKCKDYYEKYNPEKYVKIEFAKIDKKLYDYTKGVENASFTFKIIPLSNKIERITFDFDIYNSDDDLLMFQENNYTRNIYKPELKKFDVNYWIDAQKLDKITTEELNNSYRFKYSYKMLVVNGEDIAGKLDSIPQNALLAIYEGADPEKMDISYESYIKDTNYWLFRYLENIGYENPVNMYLDEYERMLKEENKKVVKILEKYAEYIEKL